MNMAIWVADKQVVGIVALAWQKSVQTSIAKIVVRSKVTVILPEIPQGRRTSP